MSSLLNELLNCITLTLPWPPSDNAHKKVGALRKTKKGKMYQARINTLETNRFYWEVRQIIQDKLKKEGRNSFDSATKVGVQVLAYPPDAKKRDITNILKVLCDSLQHGGVIEDDYQICRLLIQRADIITPGRVIVRIEAIS